MESIATSVATSVAEKAAEPLVARIGRELGYPFNYRSNISDLTQKIVKLRDARVRVQEYVDEANRQGDEIFPDVEKWLSRAEELIKETEKFVQDEREANRGCFNLMLRYQQSKKAKNQAEDIDIKIQETVKWNEGEVAHRPPPPGIGSSSVSGSEVFKSRETTLNEIMEALRDDDNRMVGVWGMGGVGKTTLVQQVAKRAQVAKQANEEKLFDTVVMALHISQSPNVKKIQGDIACMLGVNFEERENESQRAVRLSLSLKKHKKILVILDDIWEAIAFETIGIPYGSDDHKVGYCKVLLTSRDRDVLSKDMGTHRNFHLQHLYEEEAWSLFKKTAGDSVEKRELQDIATEVVKKCEGLPVAIVTIAKALKGDSVAAWRNALVELRMSAPINIRGVSQNVYSCLELSYNHLTSEVKSLFLLCGLLGDGDISLDDLLQYVMGLDLFDYIDSLEQARDKLLTLVGILKASSLLLDALEDGHYRLRPSLFFAEESNGFVRMHDVVRDVAKAIASRDPHRFVVKEALGLQGWQKRDRELENCTRISMNGRDIHELPEGLLCPKLEFLLLNSNRGSLKIPDSFFKGMKEVRVLSLFSIDLTQLPSSLLFLSNLRTLCLHRCGRLTDIAILGELKKLQVLSLKSCGIEQLPEEMMQLTDLRMLSLRDFYHTVLVPRNVISSLSRLEHLCMRDYSDERESEGVDGGGRNAWLSELKHLSCLRALEVEIQSSRLLPEDVSFENLTRYDIVIGGLPGFYDDDDDERTSRRLRLNKIKGPHLVKCFSKLLKTIEVLELSSLDDTKHFVYELEREGFLQLKYLYIRISNAMQYIMNTTEMEWVDSPHSAFPLLEELVLNSLPKLEAVWHGPIPMGCFANLRVLIIGGCPNLKYILRVPTAQGRESVLVFPQLRVLKLQFVGNLIEFYSTGTSGSQEPFIPFFNQQVALPKLESLRLKVMGNFRTVWHHQHLSFVSKLKKLYLWGCGDLLTVFPSNFLEGLQSLEILEIADCCSLKEISEVGEINTVRNKDPQGYLALQNLKSLEVGGCTCLKYLFPVSVVKCLVQLEVLKISNCGVEEIVANENGLQAMPIFLFPRLTSLKLSKLYQLKRFYGDVYTLRCPLLKTLKVRNCDEVKLLFQEKSLQGEVDKQPLFLVEKNTFPNVEQLKLGLKGGPMEIWWSQFSRESFGKLRVLEIKECHDIKVAIPSSKLQVLHNLEQLTVGRCNSVEEVIQVEGLAGETLPQLTKIYLEDLPMLTNLCGLPPILKNLYSLEISKCGNLINLVSPSMAKILVQLKKLSITACSMVKEIVGGDGSEATDDISFTKLEKLQLRDLENLKSFSSASSTFKFPSLEEMKVTRLPRLTHLYEIIPGLGQNLQKLRILQVSDCRNLEILLTPSMAKILVQLEELTVRDCYEVKEIVENEGGEATDDEIVFTKLQKLVLHDLLNVKSFCSARYTFRFPCLTGMWVIGCPKMEFFCKGDSITQSLKGIYMENYRLHWENDLNTTIQKEFMKKIEDTMGQ